MACSESYSLCLERRNLESWLVPPHYLTSGVFSDNISCKVSSGIYLISLKAKKKKRLGTLSVPVRLWKPATCSLPKDFSKEQSSPPGGLSTLEESQDAQTSLQRKHTLLYSTPELYRSRAENENSPGSKWSAHCILGRECHSSHLLPAGVCIWL